MEYDNSGKDWRFESDTRDGYPAPIPEGLELTSEECRYAGLPDDPRMTALIEHGGYMDLESYDKMLTAFESMEDIDQAKIDQLGDWMLMNGCSLALGDGDGLNFIMKAQGLVKYLLAHSLTQPATTNEG